MIESLIAYFTGLSVFGKLAIVLNISIFIIAGFLFKHVVPSGSDELNTKRARLLRLMNIFLLSIYLFDWLWNYVINDYGQREFLKQVSQTGLVFLLGYLLTQFGHSWTIKKYGKQRTIDGKDTKTRTYQSEMGFIIITLITIAVSLLLIINIWQVTSWLQATGVIGGILVILFGTKEAWAHDAVSGLIMLHQGQISPGVVCRIPSMDILAVIKRMSLTETTFHHLIQKHSIIVANSKLRAVPVEILNKTDANYWNDYVEFNIGYDTPSEQVEAYIQAVWQKACEMEKQLDPEKTPRLVLVNPGDHAIQWRMNYRVESVYRIVQARFAINRAAYDLQTEHGLSLATPLTHQAIQ
ncbi:hypothetical protein OS175_00785 [Marinicella sp. S1101]|uniref:hypothetical protein n=1 Tax=Marinicella marina TaxID=2996016 RepID=UPI0022608D4B|nr:hypothetical protein [Marinicella marina]MCX7552398.1 hypothetical protein [Marinicella marina]MDJ1139273.1 hypothetical protein [Marinicella marina]